MNRRHTNLSLLPLLLTAAAVTTPLSAQQSIDYLPYGQPSASAVGGPASLDLHLTYEGGVPSLRLAGGTPGTAAMLLFSTERGEQQVAGGGTLLVGPSATSVQGLFDDQGVFDHPLTGGMLGQRDRLFVQGVQPEVGATGSRFSAGLQLQGRAGADAQIDLGAIPDTFDPAILGLPTPVRSLIESAMHPHDSPLVTIVRGALNSPGDELKVQLKVEGSGGTAANGGLEVQVTGKFRRADDRHELSVAAELAAFIGAELKQDIEVKAAAGVGGEIVFAFDSAEEAAGALYDITVLRLAERLHAMAQRARALADLANATKQRFDGALQRTRALGEQLDRCLAVLDRTPKGAAFNEARRQATQTFRRVRDRLAAARGSAADLLAELEVRERAAEAGRALYQAVQDASIRSDQKARWLRDHFCAVELKVKTTTLPLPAPPMAYFLTGSPLIMLGSEAELKVGLSLAGLHAGVSRKTEFAATLRLERGFGEQRHLVKVALTAEKEWTVMRRRSIKFQAKRKFELARTFVVPTLDDLEATARRFVGLAQQSPAQWREQVTEMAGEFVWRQLSLSSGKLTIDLYRSRICAAGVGGELGIGRELSMEVRGDDLVDRLLHAIEHRHQADLIDNTAALVDDLSWQGMAELIGDALRMPISIARDLADTRVTYAVQDRIAGGGILGIGLSYGGNGGAVAGEITWTDKGAERKETMPARDGFRHTLPGMLIDALKDAVGQ